MSSLSYFQIDDLVEHCVSYTHENLNKIIQNTPSFSSIGDSLIAKWI